MSLKLDWQHVGPTYSTFFSLLVLRTATRRALGFPSPLLRMRSVTALAQRFLTVTVHYPRAGAIQRRGASPRWRMGEALL